MRILQIRFQNLNSLAGAWEIDLTHPAYDANGIFAITGPTGAGKTTILDAVCLALYGRTPRLDRVSKSVNEIMSRQTGECSAEVVFETLSGKYLCKWTQRRARTRPDGELQQPQQEIANAVSGEILATGIRDVAEQVEAATGMDFDRFTRSMLLAQGGFAAFLQAGPDARAPILEQITGTEIYSRLSIQVHARRAQERAALESLENQKAALRLLSPEESDELGRLLADTEIREREESSRLATVVSAVAWKERMEGLEKNLTATNAEIEALRNRLEQFSPDRSRLKTAEIAGTIELYYVMLMSLRHDQTADQNSMDEARRELPQLEKVLEQAQIALTLAELERDRLRLALQSAQPLLRDVRALDLRLQEKQGPIHTAAVTMKALTDEQALLSGEISVAEKKLAGLVDEKASLDAVMSATSGDEALIGEMAGLEAQVAAWTQQDQLYRLKAVEFDHTTMQKEAALESSKAASIRLAEIQRELSGASALRQHAMTLAEQILEGRTAPDWRTELTLMRERKQLMDKADAISQENVAREASLQVLKAQGAALAADIVSYDQGICKNIVEQKAQKSLVVLLRNQYLLARQVQTYEEARSHLVDGQPCPLCGSTLHPLSGESPVLPEEARIAFEHAEQDLINTESLLKDIQMKAAAARITQANVHAKMAELHEILQLESNKLTALMSRIFPDNPPDLVKARWKGLVAVSDMNLEQATSRMAAYDEAEAALQAAQKTWESLQETAAAASQESQASGHKVQALEQDEGRIRKELDNLHTSFNVMSTGMRTALQGYGDFPLDKASLDGALRSLAERRDLWQSRARRQLDLERSMVLLNAQLAAFYERENRNRNEFATQEALLLELRKEHHRIAFERSEKFGDKNPDQEEQRWFSDISKAELFVVLKREERDSALRLTDNGCSKMAGLEKTMASRAEKILAAESDFACRLTQAGFADLASFLSARLPESERRALRDQAERLDIEKAGLEARHTDLVAHLIAERSLQATELPRETLLSERAELEETIKSLRQETGAIRQRLRDHEDAAARNRDLSSRMEARQKECRRWDVLHELIGSADGKKYRNFAQGITFDLLIGHANSQLRRLSDRYLLVHDVHLPLELCVIDNDQAGEIRSTKNLSGGECFLVSLALAFGLSRMSSRRVRVDSLFLDEGFGTLDEDTLETALSTLASLRHDGKLIGVISHVPAIRERIATRILVVPGPGGRSTVTGPGCKNGLSSQGAS